jgi:hypothetical protein
LLKYSSITIFLVYWIEQRGGAQCAAAQTQRFGGQVGAGRAKIELDRRISPFEHAFVAAQNCMPLKYS